MKAVVENFRGIAEAHIAISPIALITGKNGAGKTSIARAVAAAVSGKPVPYEKVAKKDCGIMLHSNARLGRVSVSTDDGSTMVEWPKADTQSDGRPPFASPIATGLTDLFSMKEKDALTYLINLLKADVRKDDFITAFGEKGIDAPTAEKVWTTVDAQGWEAAHERAKTTGTKLKGAWEAITGEKYGSTKAKDWLPTEWDGALAASTPEALQAHIDDMRAALEEAIGKNAVGEAERDSLKASANSLPTLKAQSTEAEALVKATEEKLKKVEDELKANPSPDAKTEHDCPHCAGKIHVNAVSGSQYVLTKAGTISETDLKAARLKNASLCGEQQNLSQKVSEAKRKLQSIQNDIGNAERASQRISQLGEAPAVNSEEVLQAARDSLLKAEKRLKTFEAHCESVHKAGQILVNQEMISLLDEKGLRRSKLSDCLFSFMNRSIDPLCETFGISPITLDTDLNATLGKTPYQMLSASEQFRVRTVLQVAIAQLENADLIIIDNADILDQPGRGKLLQVVMKAGIPAIICMTLNKPDMAPNLASAGAGATYWVEGNTCKPVEIVNTGVKPNVAAPVAAAQEPPPVTPAKAFIQKLHEKRDGAAA
jgi:AAA domain